MRFWYALSIAFVPLVIVACNTPSKKYNRKPHRSTMDFVQEQASSTRSAGSLLRQINLRKDIVPKGRHGHWKHMPMRPRYITIHSTQNYTGDAYDHARALQKGALRGRNRIGYLIWHYTVQDNVAIQHLPTNQQGEHADVNGPGNRYSIGIEMCEHRGNSRVSTVDRTAKLAAYLMKKHNIPLSNVVPHYHWPRPRQTPAHKNCPHFLLDNGRPGRKWKAFLNQVRRHYLTIS